jgi:hypothetical protein
MDRAIQARETRNACKILIGNSRRKSPVDRHRCRCMYRTEMELEENKNIRIWYGFNWLTM